MQFVIGCSHVDIAVKAPLWYCTVSVFLSYLKIVCPREYLSSFRTLPRLSSMPQCFLSLGVLVQIDFFTQHHEVFRLPPTLPPPRRCSC